MQVALDGFIIEGVTTTIPFLSRVMDNPRFRAGDIGTDFMEYFLARNGRKAAAS